MNDLSTRLIQCFSAVFPDLTEEQIRRASLTSVPKWDSIATVTLISLIEEEFRLHVEADKLGELVTFELTLEFVKKQTQVS
jgi:acyl carrier protein